MQKQGFKDYNERIGDLNSATEKKYLKFVLHNMGIQMKKKLFIFRKYRNLNKRFFKSRVHNVCIVSNREKNIYYLGLSRIQLREYHSLGVIPGLKKFSW